MTELLAPPVSRTSPVSTADVSGPAHGRRPGSAASPQPGLGTRSSAWSRSRGLLTLLGPAFVAAIAYVDPGNFATNFQGGAAFGYRLMWVVLAANLIAMPVQYLSAKLGLVTGRSLPQMCRDALPRPVTWALWLQAEVVAMATDLAEFIGAAIGLNLLFGMPLPVAGFVTAGIAFAICALQRRGHRAFELAIGGLLALISIGFAYETLRIGPSAKQSLGGLLPSLAGHDSLLLAVGIVGATVMPHAIYLHSGLTSERNATSPVSSRNRLLRMQKVDVGVALGLAGLVNLSMLAVAAKVFHHAGQPTAPTIQQVHTGLGTAIGGGAALAFAAALLASGISSSSVGTRAGEIIMGGFIRYRIPPMVRRGITMAPAVILLCLDLDPTRALVLSQVVLSFGIPFAIVPLVIFTGRRSVMGEHVNRRVTSTVMGAVAVLLTGLNVYLLVQTFA